MTILGWLKHLCTEPDTHVDSAWAIPPWVGKMSTGCPLEKNSESCLTEDAVTRTAGIPASYTWFKVPVSTQDSVLRQHCSVLIQYLQFINCLQHCLLNVTNILDISVF